MAGYQYGVKSIWQTHATAVDFLRNCIALRMSASETAAAIAAEFGVPCSASMLTSKAKRLNIRFDSENVHNTRAKHGQGKARSSRAAIAVPRVPTPAKPIDHSHGRGLPLIGLTHRDCRWPTGVDEDGQHLFCGGSVSDKSIESNRCYCNHHRGIAYRPVGQVNMRPVRQANSTRAGVSE